jgi:hypothetical protein
MVLAYLLRIHRYSAWTEVVVGDEYPYVVVEEKAANERVSDHSISGYSISSVLLIIV